MLEYIVVGGVVEVVGVGGFCEVCTEWWPQQTTQFVLADKLFKCMYPCPVIQNVGHGISPNLSGSFHNIQHQLCSNIRCYF